MMSNISSFAIQTTSLQKESLLEEDSRLTDALKEKLPKTHSPNAPLLQVLEAAVSNDDAFDSLYQLLQYLKSFLKASFGRTARVQFVQIENCNDGDSDVGIITLRHHDAMVEIAYEATDNGSATLDPAEKAISIARLEGQFSERVDATPNPKRTKTLTTFTRCIPRKSVVITSRKSGKRKPAQELCDEDDEENENDEQSFPNERKRQEWDEKWFAMCDKVRQFKEERGHANVPKDYIPDRSLGSWVASQRTAYKEGRLRQDRIDALNALDFVWSFRTIGKAQDMKEQAEDVDWDAPAMERKWKAMLERLKEYQAENGDTRVPSGYKPDPQLAYWVQNQRVLYKKGKLPQERIELLEEIGFLWKVYPLDGSSPPPLRRTSKTDTDEKWNEMFERLKEFKDEFGHCAVQARYERDLDLGKWVQTQRRLEKEGKMKDDRKAALEAVGFVWKVGTMGERTWEDNFQRLLAFKEEWGDCLVPTKYEPDQRLASWVMWQRGKYHQNKLPDECIRKLDEIGFVWKVQRKGRRINHVSDVRGGYKNSDGFVIWSPSTTNEFWQAQLEKRKAFKAKFGHTNVPVVYFEDLQLAKWVTAQRMIYTKGQLAQDKIDQLEEIGFVWRLVRSWDDTFERLKEYHAIHGHCDVPVDYPEDPKLGRWVKAQKTFHKRKELTQERLDKLRSLGFTWSVPKGSTKEVDPAEGEETASPTMPKDGTIVATGGGKNTPASGVPLPTDKAARLRAANARLSEDRRNLEAENRELRRKLREAEEANSWEDSFEQLRDYVRINGDANVPVAGTKLGQWVARQRLKRATLSKERVEKLESLGFEWVGKRGRPFGKSPPTGHEDEHSLPPPQKKPRIASGELLAEESTLEREEEKLAEAKRKLEEEKEKLRLWRENLQAAKARRMST